jgi:hypothetical protein
VRALSEFNDTVSEHIGGESDGERVWFTLAVALARVTVNCAPKDAFGDGSGPTVAIMRDQLTGQDIEDPDAEADDAESAAALAAMRIIAAVNDDDIDLAHDVFRALGDGPAGIVMFVVLTEYAAATVIAKNERDGTLPPETVARLDQRRAAEPPDPPAPATRTSATGTRYLRLPTTDAEATPEATRTAIPHGPGHYAMSMYIPGVDGHRDAVVATLHRDIEGGALGGDVLCGTHHQEDVEAWQIPHDARRLVNRQLRAQQRRHGRPAQLVRAWQHTGPCEATP